MSNRPPSQHVRPNGAVETAQHYIRDLVYGANDGLITTFAVVAGVAGGALSVRAVLVVGAANLLADGLSMAVGNFLSIRADESARLARNLPEHEAEPVRHALATFVSFAIAGALPLLPYVVISGVGSDVFAISCVVTGASLFGVGAMRAAVTADRWWYGGLEMLGLGAIVAVVAYGAGAATAAALGGP